MSDQSSKLIISRLDSAIEAEQGARQPAQLETITFRHGSRLYISDPSNYSRVQTLLTRLFNATLLSDEAVQ